MLLTSVVIRDQLRKSSRPVGSVCSMDHSKRISDLLAQVSSLQVCNTGAKSESIVKRPVSSLLNVGVMVCVQRSETQLCEENHRLQQDKSSLEAELQLMKKERELAKAHITSTSGWCFMSLVMGSGV